MRKIKNQSESFLGVLTRNFIIFSLVIVLAIVGIFLLSNHIISSTNITLTRRNLINFENELYNKNFSAIPTNKILGDDGFLEIVDIDGNIVYSTLSTPNTYTNGELEFIQRFQSSETIEVSNFKTEFNTNRYLITKSYLIANKTESKYMLLDERGGNYYIISSTISTSAKPHLTSREFDMLSHNYYNAEKQLSKHSFVANDGENYTAIQLDTQSEIDFVPIIVISTSILVSLTLYAILLVFFIMYTNRKVQNPLKMLDNAMSDFAKNGYKEKLDYNGSLEFEQICDSFNNMVNLLNQSEEQRQVLEDDKQRMLASLSHDLKTPITVIQGFSKAINDGIVKQKDIPKYLDTIISKSEHMIDLVNSFHEYSKLEHPDFILDVKKLDISELSRTYLAGKLNEFNLKEFELSANISEERIFCMLNKKQSLRVIENLVENCFKYNEKGTSLYFSVEKIEDCAKITIADNGVGINPIARENIFNPFVVGDEARNTQGSGLGLTICKKIVEAHNGSIILSENPIDGFKTQFEISLPLSNDCID